MWRRRTRLSTMPTTIPPDSRIWARPCWSVSKLRFPRVDHQHHGVGLGHEDGRLGNSDDRRTVEDDRPIRLSERTQKTREFRRRNIRGMPRRDARRYELQITIVRSRRGDPGPVGQCNIAHARRELRHRKSCAATVARRSPSTATTNVARGGEGPGSVRRHARFSLPWVTRREGDHRVRRPGTSRGDGF